MRNKISVEFKYFDRNTCSRCKTTDSNVKRTVERLRKTLSETDAKIEFKTTKLPASKLAQSNSILINGKDIEALVNKTKKVRSSACFGCGELLENSCECRAYNYHGKRYRYVPKSMIREAILKALKK